MWRLADRQLDTFLAADACEFISSSPAPFALLVIADLLGVPRRTTRSSPSSCSAGASGTGRSAARGEGPGPHAPRVPLRAVHGLRRGPAAPPRVRRPDRPGHRHLPRRVDARGDRRGPDRRQPVRRRPGDHRPAAQLGTEADRRGSGAPGSSAGSERHRIPNFIEETLRTESPVKGDFRLSKVPTTRRRGRPPRRHHGDAGQRRRQPRPPPVPGPDHVRRAPRERTHPAGVRARHPHLPRGPAGPSRGPDQPRAPARPDRRTSASPRASTGRRRPAVYTTSPPSSCGA